MVQNYINNVYIQTFIDYRYETILVHFILSQSNDNLVFIKYN